MTVIPRTTTGMITVTKPRSKRKIDTIPTRAVTEPDGNPHFRHCPDCGCFKPKHHGGVCQRFPQTLTKLVGDGCWDGVPLPVPKGGGDEQTDDRDVRQLTEVEFREHLKTEFPKIVDTSRSAE